MEDTREYNTLTRTREIEEHLDLMTQADVGPIEKDERLDCALEAARLEFLVALDETYTPTRRDLERAVGMPFVYVEVDSTWYALPLGFVEIERPAGYALAPVLPNTRQLPSSSRTASTAKRSRARSSPTPRCACSWSTRSARRPSSA